MEKRRGRPNPVQGASLVNVFRLDEIGSVAVRPIAIGGSDAVFVIPGGGCLIDCCCQNLPERSLDQRAVILGGFQESRDRPEG